MEDEYIRCYETLSNTHKSALCFISNGPELVTIGVMLIHLIIRKNGWLWTQWRIQGGGATERPHPLVFRTRLSIFACPLSI